MSVVTLHSVFLLDPVTVRTFSQSSFEFISEWAKVVELDVTIDFLIFSVIEFAASTLFRCMSLLRCRSRTLMYGVTKFGSLLLTETDFNG